MKKIGWPRMVLILVLHLLVGIVTIFICNLKVGSTYSIEYIKETREYNLSSASETGQTFEKSEIFSDILTRQTTDLLIYTAVKEGLVQKQDVDLEKLKQLVENDSASDELGDDQESYELYQLYWMGASLYDREDLSIKYVIRVCENGTYKNYTNIDNFTFITEDYLTDSVSDHRNYLIFFPQNLEYSTSSKVDISELYNTLRSYSDVFPDSVKIWVYVQDNYMDGTDYLAGAYQSYNNRIKDNRTYLLASFAISIFAIGLFIYLTITAGMGKKGEYYMLSFDKVWFELYLTGFILTAFLLHYTYVNASNNMDILNAALASIGVCAFGSLFAFSMRRRTKLGILSKYSFVTFVYRGIEKLNSRINNSRSAAVSALVPYHIFLIANILIIFVVAFSYFSYNYILMTVCLVVLIIVDAVTAVVRYKKEAEKKAIIEGIVRIKDGDFDYKVDISDGASNADLAEAVNSIGDGLKNAVSVSMRDEKMKSELITNLSHDLKTPLTSIISYVNLLESEKIDNPKADEYIRIIDEKSAKLKILLEEVIDASKVSSGNIEIHYSKLNIYELLRQAAAEYIEDFDSKKLTTIFVGETKKCIKADGKLMWRILDNLFGNIVKYSMYGTRVYVTTEENEGRLSIEIKNVSAQQNTLQGADLTEKFIRGDASRSTEGNGLGLFIAKSLTELQKGTFGVTADGDLFKVKIVFDLIEE